MRSKSYRRLREEDRHCIARLSKAGKSQSEIALAIGFSQSTVSKELGRNRSEQGYLADLAHGLAEKRRRSKRPRGRSIQGEVARQVRKLLRRKHSPEQISATMRLSGYGPSHETIYRYIELDAQQGGELRSHLRINSRRRHVRRRRGRAGRIVGRVDISERPGVVDARLRYGDWEADLVSGRLVDQGCALTLLERKSRLAFARKLPSKDSDVVARAIVDRLSGLKVLSITFDNGLEFAQHRLVAEALQCRTYFCRPFRSCDKGAIENYNGLLRQYIPKHRFMREISPQEVEFAERELNHRPRKILGFKSPIQYIAKIANADAAINLRAYSLEV